MKESHTLNEFKIDDNQSWTIPFQKIDISNSELKRMRFTQYNDKDIFNLGSRWGPKFSFYYDVLGKVEKQLQIVLLNIINDIKIKCKTEDEIKKRLADIGRYCKIQGNKAVIGNKIINNNKWKYFVNLEMLGDYAPDDINELNQGLERWLLVEKDIKLDKRGKDIYYKYFEDALRDFFRPMQTGKITPMSLETFVNHNELWGTGGSGGNVMKDIDDEFKNKFVNTKKSLSMLLDPNKIMQRLRNHNKQRLKVNIKRELVKSRGVVNVDLYTYIMMSYLSYHFEPMLNGMEKTPLFQKKKKDVLNQLNKIVENIDKVNVPLDQSTFDANVNHRMVRLCWKALKQTIQANIHYKDIDNICDRMDTLITNGDVVYKINGILYKKKFNNGIPSGWRWTSLFDSAINYAQLKAGEQMLNDCGQWIHLENIVVQGDDVQCNVRTEIEGERLIAFTDLIGLEVNRKKMYIDKKRSEFLRLTYTHNEDNTVSQFGYPARMLAGIFFGKPDDNERISLNSTIDQWQKFRRRANLFNNKWLFNVMINDIEKKINTKNRKMFKEQIKREDIISYIIRKKANDGYGEINKLKLEITDNTIKEVNNYELDDEIKGRIEKAVELNKRLTKQDKSRLKDNEKYIRTQIQWYGTRRIRYYEKIEVQKRKNIVVDSSKETKYKTSVRESKGLRDISLRVQYRIGNDSFTMSSAQLKEMLDMGRSEYEQKYQLNVVNSITLSGWLRSSKTWQNRILEKNESLIINNTTQQGVNLNNLICYYEQLKIVNCYLKSMRWTSSLLTLCQLRSQQFVSDMDVNSTE